MRSLYISSFYFKAIFLMLILSIFLLLTGSFSNTFAASNLPTNTPTPTTDPCPNRDCKPTDIPTPTSAPAATNTPAPEPTATPAPAATNTPAPTATPKPTVKPTVFIPVSNTTPTEEPEESPTPTPTPSLTATPMPTEEPAKRSIFVASIASPKDIPVSPELLFLSLLTAGFLVLLIVFPAELFNATVQSNYDEISRWSIVHRSQVYYKKLSRLPSPLLVSIFALMGAIINSFLSPDIGFNKPTYALVLGMLLALVVIVSVYDLTRMIYMKKRFGVTSKLRAHSIGLVTGTLLVVISRLSNFLPGYCYGIFTGLVYGRKVSSKEDGEGLAASAVMLLAVALVGWFAWIPIKDAATSSDPSLWVLTIDAAFASLWVSTLTATIFGLAPLRYLYGEQVKKWSFPGWAIIYITGVFLFVYTLLNPAVGIYGKSDKVSWIAVLSLFFGFGIFSLAFWSYFRFRVNFGWKPKK